MSTHTNYQVGSVVEYETFDGSVRRVEVEARHENIKNGRAGFDAQIVGTDGDDGLVWGYDEQIVRVVSL